VIVQNSAVLSMSEAKGVRLSAPHPHGNYAHGITASTTSDLALTRPGPTGSEATASLLLASPWKGTITQRLKTLSHNPNWAVDARPLKQQQTRRPPPPPPREQTTDTLDRCPILPYLCHTPGNSPPASTKGVYSVELDVGRAASHHLSQHDRSYRARGGPKQRPRRSAK
jgi:hypothetical protein